MLKFEEIEAKVWRNSLETCHYISGYITRNSNILVKCEKHNYEFTTRYENIARDSRAHHICPLCQEEDKNRNKISMICDYCGKEFHKTPSKIRSEFNFCCRECKDMAQRMSSGKKFDEMRPNHYDTGEHNYRKHSFAKYEHKCAVCGWNEDEDVLEVHHIDENRNNNSVNNLIILCPTCHRKLTTHKYELVDRKTIIKK